MEETRNFEIFNDTKMCVLSQLMHIAHCIAKLWNQSSLIAFVSLRIHKTIKPIRTVLSEYYLINAIKTNK